MSQGRGMEGDGLPDWMSEQVRSQVTERFGEHYNYVVESFADWPTEGWVNVHIYDTTGMGETARSSLYKASIPKHITRRERLFVRRAWIKK